MSHASVMARVSAERIEKHNGNLQDALEEMMAPFDEGTKDRLFLSFVDNEDELRTEYETESCDRVRGPTGELFSPYDERFRVRSPVPRTPFVSWTASPLPDGYVRVAMRKNEVFPTLDAYAADYCDTKRDPDTKRLGYWSNPNAKWDWWTIGGRFSGTFPVKTTPTPKTPILHEMNQAESFERSLITSLGGKMESSPQAGFADVVLLSDIDMDRVASLTREEADKFFREYEAMLAGKVYPAFEGPRDYALRLGLVDVVRGPAEKTDGVVVLPWSRTDRLADNDERRTWNDVAKVVSKEEFDKTYMEGFNPLVCFAALDDDGWHEPGKMGFFGMSDATPTSMVEFKRGFVQRFIRAAKPTDVFVAIDYHC